MKRILLVALIALLHSDIEAKTVLVFGGKTGWIGKKIVQLLRDQGHNPVCGQSKLENREAIIVEINNVHPDYIINAAGIIGKPNVDWCETHKQETIRTNVLGTINLIDIAYQHNIHVTNISTGCIYEYDAAHPMWSGKGFTEDDEPNFNGSFYSRTKILLEKLALEYPNVLHLRVKMPISTDLEHGFVAKIITYEKVVNIPNSLCVLDDLLPIAIDMTFREIKGVFNFVNPGAVSHNQVLDLYKEMVDPNHTYKNFTVEEQDRILKARRANAELDASKLLSLYPDIPDIKASLINVLKKIKNNSNRE